jgi:prepilin-type N-terminal cleavage/methylation domain-containing protein
MEMMLMTKLECRMSKEDRDAFTLVELLVVIAIIAALLGLAFPVFQGVLDRAKKVQAKNDVTQIVTAVNAFYTEYGKYPLVTDDTPIANNSDLFYTLRAAASGANVGNAVNTRQIVFISPPDVKDTTNPRSGIGTDGKYYDPWGTPYVVTIDGNYDNQIANPYSDSDGSAGAAQLRSGVIACSFGKNGALGGGAAASSKYAPESGTAGKYKHSSDVISWQ